MILWRLCYDYKEWLYNRERKYSTFIQLNITISNVIDCRPDDDNDAVKDVIGVPQVLKEAKSGQL